jgi:hypothetical protein
MKLPPKTPVPVPPKRDSEDAERPSIGQMWGDEIYGKVAKPAKKPEPKPPEPAFDFDIYGCCVTLLDDRSGRVVKVSGPHDRVESVLREIVRVRGRIVPLSEFVDRDWPTGPEMEGTVLGPIPKISDTLDKVARALTDPHAYTPAQVIGGRVTDAPRSAEDIHD